jgi:xanthine dehydrogenase accessory factor
MWKFVLSRLEEGTPVMVIVVVDRQGSSPGKQGFKMAVAGDGTLAGSVGGGVMEYQMVELARKRLADGEEGPLLKRQVHDPAAEAERSGLICSGEQTHAFVLLQQSDLNTVEALCKAEERALKGWLVIGPGGMSFSKEAPETPFGISWQKLSEAEWRYIEAVGEGPCLYIFGGGHVSVPLSQVFRMLGFRVVVLDDREGLNTMESNDFAHEKRQVDYRRAGELFAGDSNTYVVIMTVSHATDQLILGQMLGKPLKYLGMIGSHKKVQKIFDTLRAKGASDEQLKKVDSPMGLQINSQTPEEIVISIAAKIIQVKNE